MRDYGKVFSRIWESEDFRSLTEDGRALVLYLLTCKHATIAGVFRLPDGYACEDLQWSSERVREAFANASTKGFATRDEATKWVWITKFLEWNPPENPNQKKSAAKIAASVPEQCSWRAEFLYVASACLGTSEPEPCGTVAEPFPNQKQKQKQEQKQETPPLPPVGEPEGFKTFWAEWPSSDRKGSKAKCLEAWRKGKCEGQAVAILAHVQRLKTSDDWKREGGRFIPAPLVYLNQRRWDGAEGSTASSGLQLVGVI